MEHTKLKYPIYDKLETILYHQPIEAAIEYAVVYGLEDLTFSEEKEDVYNEIPKTFRWFLKSKTVEDAIKKMRGSLAGLFVLRYHLYGEQPHEINKYYTGVLQKRIKPDRMFDWQIETINRLINSVEPLQEDLIVYRGEDNKQLLEKNGFKYKAFISTTLSKEIATFFLNNRDYKTERQKNGVLLHITLRKGTRVLPVWMIDSDLSNEWEVLLSNSVRFVVIRKTDDVWYMRNR